MSFCAQDLQNIYLKKKKTELSGLLKKEYSWSNRLQYNRTCYFKIATSIGTKYKVTSKSVHTSHIHNLSFTFANADLQLGLFTLHFELFNYHYVTICYLYLEKCQIVLILSIENQLNLLHIMVKSFTNELKPFKMYTDYNIYKSN